MVRLWLEAGDLARVRFADRPHPAGTVLLASQALREPSVAATVPVLAGRLATAVPALRPLHHLMPARGFLPDFLTPLAGGESIEDGLAAIRSTPPRQVRAEITEAYAHTPASATRRRFAAADPQMLELLLAAMRAYFHRVLAPDWPALVRAQRQQVAEAASRYVRSGAAGVLADLHPGIRWRPPVLEVDAWQHGEARPGGHGLILVPSPFAGPRPRVLVAPGQPALVVYPVPPPATLNGRREAAGALERLLGRTRSAVLFAVARPGRHTTSAVASRLGISVSSSSEHLTALRAAGLVVSVRDGGAVVHRPTALCRELLDVNTGSV
jgi:DNA-binding transcriptional ArsR family regulator